MPISALPSKYGIGSLGEGAYRFVDFLKAAGQKYWQILPLTQTGYGDSPYQSCSDKSGNPYFIDLEILHRRGLISKRELQNAIDKSPEINYGKLYSERYTLLRKAFLRFDAENAKFVRFVKSGKFADYALFMALKQKFGAPFYVWPEEYKRRNPKVLRAFVKENKDEVLFWQFLQHEFFNQWEAVKKYAHSNGIKIIGDLPLYVAPDSEDVWVDPEAFMLDDDLRPVKVAGVPPDYFCEDGQHWGNPVYDYDSQSANGYKWWKNRLKRALSTYDYVRIDHFRGLDRFWSVDAEASDARNGIWSEGPREKIFEGISSDRIIAEDLGLIDDGVIELLGKTGFPNMKVLQFAFGGGFDNPYLPWNVKENCIYYTGTHDNDTVIGFLDIADEDFRGIIEKRISECLEYLEVYKTVSGKYSYAESFIDIIYASRANVAVIPVHDALLLGGEYRINRPGTVGNWTVRYRKRLFTQTAARLLKRKVRRFER
ncbi:MAG: 4-alpha-glucanotransferase [Clostridia bacterium]|nr:4-alpha-glucanotransferase [Clostridia bacterium]